MASGAGLAVLSALAVASMIDAHTLAVMPMDVTLRRELRAVWPGPAQPRGPVAELLAIAAAAGRADRRRDRPWPAPEQRLSKNVKGAMVRRLRPVYERFAAGGAQ